MRRIWKWRCCHGRCTHTVRGFVAARTRLVLVRSLSVLPLACRAPVALPFLSSPSASLKVGSGVLMTAAPPCYLPSSSPAANVASAARLPSGCVTTTTQLASARLLPRQKRQLTTLTWLDAMIKLTRSMKTEKLFSPTFRPFTIIHPLTCECPKKGCHVNISVNGIVVVNAHLNIQRIGNIFGKTDFANVTALELKRNHGNRNRSNSFWNMRYGHRRDEQG